MVRNAALPHVEVDPRTFDVRADGALLTAEPAVTRRLSRESTCCDDPRGRPRRHRRPRRIGQDRARRGATRPSFARRGRIVSVITNDLVTAEDAERVRRSGLIDPLRVRAVEAGGCPHTVIREDPSLNIAAADDAGGPLSRHRADPARVRRATTSPRRSRATWWTSGCSSSTSPAATTFRASAGPASSDATCWSSTRSTSRPTSASTCQLMRKEADDVRGGRPVVAISARGGSGVDAVADVLDREVLFR